MAERSLRQLLAAAGVKGEIVPATANPLITHIAVDSRTVKRGGLFIAISGTKADGHEFVDPARAQGAAAIVIQRGLPDPEDIAFVRVENTAEAAAKIAAAFHGLRGSTGHQPRLVGITGTNGKSTTTILTQAILKMAGHPTALFGTIYYDVVSGTQKAAWTTPPAIELCENLAAAAKAGATHAVMEVSSHALDQHRTDGLRFSAAIFTNLTGDHLDYHHTLENYLNAKARLFEQLDSEAVAIVNGEDPASTTVLANCRASVIRYGMDGEIEARARIVSASADGYTFDLLLPRPIDRPMTGIQWRLDENTEPIRIRAHLVGRHNVMNMLAAACAARALGLADSAIRDGLESVTVVPGRLQRVNAEGLPFSVFVDYAHSDDSLRHALKTLRPLTTGRLICLFGCGGNRDRTKRPRMAAVVAELSDVAVLTSDNPRWEDPKAIVEETRTGFEPSRFGRICELIVEVDRRAAIAAAVELAHDGDTLLIAGKGHEDYQEIRGERFPFDDVVVAAECLKRRAHDPVGIG